MQTVSSSHWCTLRYAMIQLLIAVVVLQSVTPSIKCNGEPVDITAGNVTGI